MGRVLGMACSELEFAIRSLGFPVSYDEVQDFSKSEGPRTSLVSMLEAWWFTFLWDLWGWEAPSQWLGGLFFQFSDFLWCFPSCFTCEADQSDPRCGAWSPEKSCTLNRTMIFPFHVAVNHSISGVYVMRGFLGPNPGAVGYLGHGRVRRDRATGRFNHRRWWEHDLTIESGDLSSKDGNLTIQRGV